MGDYLAGCLIASIFVLLAIGLLTRADQACLNFNDKEQTSSQHVELCESWRHFATRDPAGLFTLWLAVIGVGQAALFLWQLSLFREGLRDGEQSANAAREAANAAKEQANLMRESLVASERAWLRINLTMGDQPLHINEQGISTAVEYTIDNIGNAPALKVAVQAWIGLMSRSIVGEPHISFRSAAEKERQSQWGQFALFPGETYPRPGAPTHAIGVGLSKADVEDGVFCGPDEGRNILPLITVCVTYSFPSDTTERHQTRVTRQISRTSHETISLDVGGIPAKDLWLYDGGHAFGFEAD